MVVPEAADTGAAPPKFLAVDFYCGAGGTARGLIDAGGYVIAGIDKDEACNETYRRNNRNEVLDGALPGFVALDMFPRTPEYPQGQQHMVRSALEDLVPRYRAMAPGAPLLFAVCAPCQSFTKFVQRSMTRERSNGRDRDQGLLSQTLGFIADFKPELIVSENVATIRRGRYRHVWDQYQQELRQLGYAVSEGTVCASAFGVPQRRRRSFIAAAKNWTGADADLDPPWQMAADPMRTTVREAIGHLPPLRAGESRPGVPNHVCRNLTEVNRRRLMAVKPGEPNFGFGDLAPDCHRRLGAKERRGFGDVYTRMHPDRPSPTITTRFISVSNGRFGHYDERQVRGLSLREGAILQSFPERYEFFGDGMAATARMIGNAVPPLMIKHMSDWLLETWTGNGGFAGDAVPADGAR